MRAKRTRLAMAAVALVVGLAAPHAAGLSDRVGGWLAQQAPSIASSADESAGLAAHAWDVSESPYYYAVRGRAQVTDIDAGQVDYSGLDSLGRTRAVTAKVTYGMVAEADAISGWGHNREVTVSLPGGRTYSGYAFNRSHLLADSLGGHAVKENLVTGTRTQNC